MGSNRCLKGSHRFTQQRARITACSAAPRRGLPARCPSTDSQPLEAGATGNQGGFCAAVVGREIQVVGTGDHGGAGP